MAHMRLMRGKPHIRIVPLTGRTTIIIDIGTRRKATRLMFKNTVDTTVQHYVSRTGNYRLNGAARPT